MFSFFTKKEYLVDHLEGFIDIHNHILPGIDDGAKNVEESIELIKGFGEFGVSNFICTPHIMENYYPNTPETIKNSLALLQNDLKNSIENVSVDAAAEHMVDSGFEKKLENNQIMPLAKNYILIEISYLQPSLNLFDMVEKIADINKYPILAHPERYIYLHNNIGNYNKFKSKGMLLQLNMLSLGGFYGKDVQKVASKLVEENMIDFIASDIHNKRQLESLRNMILTGKILDRVRPIIEKTCYNFS